MGNRKDSAESYDIQTDPVVEHELQRGSLFGGRYRIERRLAAGGMASIWSAVDEARPQLQRSGMRRVALKIMKSRPEDAADMRQRFAQEIAIAAFLEGPSFVRMLDHGDHKGMAFMVMELLDGEDLHDRVNRTGKISLRETQWTVQSIARGLAITHAAGIIHRDLKPHNIFITRPRQGAQLLSQEPPAPEIKILDFGVAKLGGSYRGLTEPGTVVGSTHYMSPEQALSAQYVDYRADLWSLAAIIYRCLAGRPVFVGNDAKVLHQIIEGKPASVRTYARGLPPIADEFFAQALSKDPRARFQSAVDLSRAFDAVVEAASVCPADETEDRAHTNGLKWASPTAVTIVAQTGAGSRPTCRATPGYPELLETKAPRTTPLPETVADERERTTSVEGPRRCVSVEHVYQPKTRPRSGLARLVMTRRDVE